MVMMKKVADRDFLAFRPFENERKFRENRRNDAKNLKFERKVKYYTPRHPGTYERIIIIQVTKRITDS